MGNSLSVKTLDITKEAIIIANPLFFNEQLMRSMKTDHIDWEIKILNDRPYVLVNRPASQGKACYFINERTLRLSFHSHINNKVNYL